jgi:aspartyl-tRNA(Asn)/glutamyl-tRNA(Gln) amidotransferase subunit B
MYCYNIFKKLWMRVNPLKFDLLFMEIDYSKYEAVIGLEVHAQMLTKSKAYCADANEYGSLPNTNISAVSLGHPGTLPVHNKSAVEYAVKLGIACHSHIAEHNYYARKNYFYADLPKGYQISQHTTPICEGGYIDIKLKSGEQKRIRLIRIHMEEDTGKSMHDQDLYDTLLDYNRAGVPLVEMVSEPDIRTGEEAYQFLTEVRKLVRYLDICDGNMEEGSMRCDANVSVRIRGEKEFGVKVEVKNMNSISNVQRAIDFEIKRQIEAIEKGEKIFQETRTFNALKGDTMVMRTKEGASDYRYFPEPDLPPLHITQSYIDEVKQQMPALPKELFEKFTQTYGLNAYDAAVLTDDKETALYFEKVLSHTQNYKAAANWVMVHIRGYLKEQALDIKHFVLHPHQIAQVIHLVDEGKISNSAASQKVFPAMLEQPTENVLQLAQQLNVLQQSDGAELQKWIDEAIAKFPEKVLEYKAGKTSLVGLFMGEVMKLSKGKADPKIANKMVQQTLDSK